MSGEIVSLQRPDTLQKGKLMTRIEHFINGSGAAGGFVAQIG